MRHIAALMLAQLGGNQNPTGADLAKILASVGIQADQAQLEKLIAEINGKDVSSIITEGMKKLASMPAGGAAPSAASSAAPAAAASSAAAGKKEPEPVKEESDEEMGMGLFD